MNSFVENEELQRAIEEIIPTIISRAEWKASKPRRKRKLVLPVEKIIFCHTKSPPCYNKDECSRAVKKLQDRHLSDNKSDIQHNFMIGRDGSVFEGRGWNHAPCKVEEDKEGILNEKSIDVGFIGEPYMEPTKFQVKAALGLIAKAIKEKFVQEDVTIYQFEFSKPLFPNPDEEDLERSYRRNKATKKKEKEDESDSSDDNEN